MVIYIIHKIKTYADINECESDSHTCDSNAICKNTFGSYECNCITGYVAIGKSCDVNECDSDNHRCHTNAVCTNIFGSYDCDCAPGYFGNGTLCEGKI